VREALAVPVALDAASGAISSRLAPQHRFRFGYAHEGGRDSAMLKALEIAARIIEAARGNIAAQAQQAQQQPAFTLPAAAGIGGAGASSGHAHHAAAHLLHHPFAATKVTESFIPTHLDHEAKARAAAAQQVGLKRVSLVAQGQAAAAAAAAATAATASSSSTSCGSQGCATCGCSSSDDPAAAGAGGDGAVFVIHACMRPDLLCGHSHELEVTAGN
jgi:hypothetical protein